MGKAKVLSLKKMCATWNPDRFAHSAARTMRTIPVSERRRGTLSTRRGTDPACSWRNAEGRSSEDGGLYLPAIEALEQEPELTLRAGVGIRKLVQYLEQLDRSSRRSTGPRLPYDLLLTANESEECDGACQVQQEEVAAVAREGTLGKPARPEVSDHHHHRKDDLSYQRPAVDALLTCQKPGQDHRRTEERKTQIAQELVRCQLPRIAVRSEVD